VECGINKRDVESVLVVVGFFVGGVGGGGGGGGEGRSKAYLCFVFARCQCPFNQLHHAPLIVIYLWPNNVITPYSNNSNN